MKVVDIMKNSLIKILSLLMCVLLMLSVCTPVFADDADGIGSVVTDTGEMINGAMEDGQDPNGIIDAAKLKGLIDSYITENGLSGKNKVISIGYCYTATGDTWYYDGDQWCYSASLYKVPCCMLLAEKEHNGEITSETMINSQYANGTVDHMEQRSIVYSDNYTGHAIVEYLGGTYSGKCADMTIKYTDLPEDYFPADFSAYSYYSAKYYTQILKTLFTQSEKFPRIMDYMKQDQNYHYLDLNLNGQYETAQKYGAFEEKTGNKNYHSAGIIYTPNPIIVTIMTKNITGFEKHIGAIAKILVDYTLTLDSELAAYKQQQIIAQQEEAARVAREEQERLAAEAAAQAAAAQQAAQASQSGTQTAQTDVSGQTGNVNIFVDPTPAPASASSSQSGGIASFFTLPVIIGLIALAAIFLVIFLIKLRKTREEDDDDFDDEDYEEYMRGDISDLAPQKEKTSFADRMRRSSNKESYEDYDEFESEDYEEDDGYYERKPSKKSSKTSLFSKLKRRGSDKDYDEYSDSDDYEEEYRDPYDEYLYAEENHEEPSERRQPQRRKARPVQYEEENDRGNAFTEADSYDEYATDYDFGDEAYSDYTYESDGYDASFNGAESDTALYGDDYSELGDKSYYDAEVYDDYSEPERPERRARDNGRGKHGNGYSPRH